MKFIKKTLSQKECSRCGEMKDNREYFRGAGSSTFCKKCETIRQREKHYKTKYNITISEYEEILDRQGGKCKICGGKNQRPDERLNIDHDHESGKVRGLLCYCCNISIGQLGDKSENLYQAYLYLKENEK